MARPTIASVVCAYIAAASASRVHVGRRAFVAGASSSALALVAPASHAATFALAPAARVTTYPGLEYLEPIYELKLSLESLAAVADDPQRYPALKKRLDKFFGGGLLSEKYYFAGLSLQYTNKIVYNDLDDFVKQDKQQRTQAMEDTLSALEGLQTTLTSKAPEADAVTGAAAKAKSGILRWLSLVPSEDVQACDALYRAVRTADANRDGILDDNELGTLPETERSVWKRRVELVGP